MNRPPKVATEIVSHCTKCGLDLTHVIVAMVAGAPKRVLCRTCGTEHAYRRPLEERGAPTPVRTSAARVRSTPTRTAELEAAHERIWRDHLAGKPSNAFVAYSPHSKFAQDQLLRHAKFGDGFVARVIDTGKIEVVFRDGPRTLAHGLGS